MKFLVLYKKSTYEINFSRLSSKETLRFKQTHERHYASLAAIEKILKSKKINYDCYKRGLRINYDKYNAVITVGGDGTFLEASHFIKKQVIMGVNSDPTWSVGRFCTATLDNFEHNLDLILANNAPIELLPRMSVRLKSHKREVLVLNDILICHHNPAAMSRYYIFLDGKKEDQRSSGIWVATAAGSSGAICSAGGKVLPQTSKELQFKVREPYQSFGFAYKLKGGIITKMAVTSLMREGIIFIDGAHKFFPFPFGEQVVIKQSKYPLKMAGKK